MAGKPQRKRHKLFSVRLPLFQTSQGTPTRLARRVFFFLARLSAPQKNSPSDSCLPRIREPWVSYWYSFDLVFDCVLDSQISKDGGQA